MVNHEHDAIWRHIIQQDSAKLKTDLYIERLIMLKPST